MFKEFFEVYCKKCKKELIELGVLNKNGDITWETIGLKQTKKR